MALVLGSSLGAVAQTPRRVRGTVEQLERAVEEFAQQFQTSDGEALINEPATEAMNKADESQEAITRHVPPRQPVSPTETTAAP